MLKHSTDYIDRGCVIKNLQRHAKGMEFEMVAFTENVNAKNGVVTAT